MVDLRILIIALLVLISSYICTYETDGEWVLCLILFGMIAVYYIAHTILVKEINIRKVLFSFVIFEASGIAGMMANPSLEGMAGVLYYFIPLFIACISFAGLFVSLIRRIKG